MDNKLDKISLVNVNMAELRKLLGRSLMCDSKLGFTIDADGTIVSYAGENSFFKKWTDDVSRLCEKIDSTIRAAVKVFIYDGGKFSSKVLSSFGDSANITIFCKNIQGTYIADMIEVKNNVLTIRTLCSPIRLGFIEMTPEQETAIFENTTNLRTLTMTSQQFKTISHYGSFNMLGKEVAGIDLKTTPEGLIATDGSFVYVIDPAYPHDLQPISMNKSLIRFIDDNETYECRIATTSQGRDVMTLRSTTSDLVMTMSLMIDTSAEFDDNDEDLGF